MNSLILNIEMVERTLNYTNPNIGIEIKNDLINFCPNCFDSFLKIFEI